MEDYESLLFNPNYEAPDTTIQFFKVPWGKDYKNIVDFASYEDQTNKMQALAEKTINKFNIVMQNGTFNIEGDYNEFQYYNYIRFKNNNYSAKWYYAFIDRIEYVGKDVTRIYTTLDIWQTYQFNIQYYNSFIERGHIPKANDTVGANTLPEPIGSNQIYSSESALFNDLDWNLQWCVVSKSKQSIVRGVKSYNYGGNGSQNTLSGVYCFYIDTATDLKNLLEKYQSENLTVDFLEALSDQSILTGKTIEQMLALIYGMQAGSYQDHRNDLIAISAIPKWAKSSSGAVESAGSQIIAEESSVSFSKTQLANGYTPRNKKLLTSLYNVIVLYNRNGFRQILKPELINGTSVNIVMSTCSQPEGVIKMHVSNYDDIINADFGLPYNAQTNFAYNGTAGNEWRNIAGGISGTISAVAGVGASLAGKNALGVISNASGVVNNAVSLADSLAPHGVLTGASNGRLDTLMSNVIPRLAKVCPNIDECREIDDFLDVYGYAVSRHANINSFKNTRSNWNYLKTSDANLKLSGGAEYEQLIKDIFNSGVTVWHDIASFGDYSKNNN